MVSPSLQSGLYFSPTASAISSCDKDHRRAWLAGFSDGAAAREDADAESANENAVGVAAESYAWIAGVDAGAEGTDVEGLRTTDVVSRGREEEEAAANERSNDEDMME